jgi:hypothetical protein
MRNVPEEGKPDTTLQDTGGGERCR